MKKIISLVFIAGLLCAVPFARAEEVNSFPDISSLNLNKDAITDLKTDGVVEGYPDGTYKPDNTINRAEFTKIVMETFYPGESKGSDCFSDVKGDWYAKYVCAAYGKGIIKGYPDGTFRPGRNINFAEASKIIVNASGKVLEEPADDNWFKNYVEHLAGKNAIPVTIDYMDRKTTRGEMAEIVWRLNKTKTSKPSKTYEALISPLPKISSCGELLEKHKLFQYKEGRATGMVRGFGMTEEAVMFAQPDAEPMAMADAKELGGGAEGEGEVAYSSTNIQVEGVDEADIVKNDSEYIYIVKGSTVRIVKAYPPAELAEIGGIEFDDGSFYPRDMYVDGGKLTVIGDSYTSFNYESATKLYIYDVSDKDAINLERTVSFEGYYSTSRKVDDTVYLVMNKHVYYPLYEEISDSEVLLPRYSDSSEGGNMPVAACTDILFFPRYETTEYLIVAGVPLEGPESKIEKEVLMGAGSDVYSSRENLYVAQTVYRYNEQAVYDLWMPPHFMDSSTVIYRFALNDGDVAYASQGEVPGTVKNQFSMDEYKDHFRLVTTKGQSWDEENPSSNNLYILGTADMAITGKVENMAPGEEIYSARFMGGRAYMVTFKRIDPFFVLDVSDPANPRILGKLKIPGYSDYLHPYDENHIIGIGKDTTEPTPEEKAQGWTDFVWYQGIKIAMFDVTDVANPVQIFKEIVGDRGTDSELLHDHKALLFDKEKGLFAFPVLLAEIPNKESGEYTGSEYGDYVFQGAYIYNVDLGNGFQLKGKISHYDDDEVAEKSGYYWYDDKNIKRILYIGDYFYTVSMGMVKANGMTDVAEAASVELEGEEDGGVYPYPEPLMIE